jgi:hypothetical protein
VDKFAAHAIKANADVAVVITPNNPAFIAVPKHDLIGLSEKLTNHDCQLIIDESFIDFTQDPDQFSMEDEIEHYPNIAIFKSMSKAYGIYGIRIGYLVTTNLQFANAVRQGIHILNINGFAEEFLGILPDFRTDFIKSCDQVRKDRDKLYENLNAFSELSVYQPDANFIFCRLPDTGLNKKTLTWWMRWHLSLGISRKVVMDKSPDRPSHQIGMLWFAKYLPNICSLTGLLCALLGIYFAVLQHFSIAIIAMIWAVLFDWGDGIIAQNMEGRTEKQGEFDGTCQRCRKGCRERRYIW